MPRPIPLVLSVISVISVAFLSAGAKAATLPNELPGDVPLTVIARGAAGPYYRPATWTVLKVTIENRGRPFAASVRVRETRGRREALFLGAARTELRRGTNPLDLVFAPGGPAAGTTLEIVRLGPGEGSREVVYRGDLSRVLRPLGTGQTLVLGVGLHAFPAHLVPGSVVWTIDPRESPERTEAYAAVDLVVIEEARRESISDAQARVLLDHVRGGRALVLASFRALAPLGLLRRLPGRAAPQVWAGEGDGGRQYYDVAEGAGHVVVFPVEPGDASPWKATEELARLLNGFIDRGGPSPWIDTGALEALAPERPFAEAASRARVVVTVGALLATVAVALLARARRRIAAVGIGSVAVAWAVAATVAWQKPQGAARIVRVRAFTADGRAEVVTDTAVLAALDKETDLAFETDTGPVLPVARRTGEASARAFVLEARGDTWRISSLLCPPGGITVARAVSIRAPAGAKDLRTKVLARGDRAKVVKLPGGRRKIEPVTGEVLPAARYFLERFAPPAEEVAWAWVEGTPEGARAPECDEAPGSGTLLVAGVMSHPGDGRQSPEPWTRAWAKYEILDRRGEVEDRLRIRILEVFTGSSTIRRLGTILNRPWDAAGVRKLIDIVLSERNTGGGLRRALDLLAHVHGAAADDELRAAIRSQFDRVFRRALAGRSKGAVVPWSEALFAVERHGSAELLTPAFWEGYEAGRPPGDNYRALLAVGDGQTLARLREFERRSQGSGVRTRRSRPRGAQGQARSGVRSRADIRRRRRLTKTVFMIETQLKFPELRKIDNLDVREKRARELASGGRTRR